LGYAPRNRSFGTDLSFRTIRGMTHGFRTGVHGVEAQREPGPFLDRGSARKFSNKRREK
jgi:hypothetical protein